MTTGHYSQRRVVITGVGVVSPIGCTKDDFWQSLMEARSGIGALESASSGHSPGRCAGEVTQFRGHIDDFGDLDKAKKKAIRKALKLMNRETQMAVAATQHALGDSGLADDDVDPERSGVSYGAGYVSMMPQDFLDGIQSCTDSENEFDFSRWGSSGLEKMTPLWLLTCLPNMPACHISIYNDLRGPNNSITQREAAANQAVAEASHIIADGAADIMIAGATGTNILPLNMLHTVMEQEVADDAPDPTKLCRPFDRQRTGSVIGEAAATVILEDFDSAVGRGAHIYGEVVGSGSNCAAAGHHAEKRSDAIAHAIKAALESAATSADSVGHVHAHGLSGRLADIEEARAVRQVFGGKADTLPVVAAKSYTGNAGAGSGAVELVASLLALEHGNLFPVLNYEQPDPECPISPVTTTGVEAGSSFLNLSVVPQGQASCLLVRSVE